MAWRWSMWKISSLCHRGACFAAWGLFSSTCSVLGAFFWLYFCAWMKRWKSFCLFCGCIHFPLFSFSSWLGFSLSPSSHLLAIHSKFKHDRLLRAFGNEVSAHLWREDHSLQLLPHVGHWHVHMASSVCPTGQTGKDQRLVSCTEQPLRVDPGWRLWHSSAKMSVLALKSLLLKVLFLQVDLEKTKRLTGIVTQGAKDFGVVQFVSVFKIAYSNDGESWSTVKEEDTGNEKVRQA